MTLDNLNLEPLSDTEKLLIIRKRLQMSQFQFAKEIGIEPAYYGKIERGQRNLSKNIRKKINDFLNREKWVYDKILCS